MKALSFWLLVVRIAIVVACVSQCSKGGSHAAVEVKASCVDACDHESHQTYRADSSARVGQIIYETPWHGSVPSARVNREVRYGNAVHGKSGSTPDRASSKFAERSRLTQDIGESALMRSDTSVLPAARSWGAKAGCFGGCVRRTAGLLQGGAAVARRAHNPKVGGAIPSPATVSAADAKTATFVVSNDCDQSRVAQQGQTGHGPRSQCSMARAVCTVDTFSLGAAAAATRKAGHRPNGGDDVFRRGVYRSLVASSVPERVAGSNPATPPDTKNRSSAQPIANVGRPASVDDLASRSTGSKAERFSVEQPAPIRGAA